MEYKCDLCGKECKQVYLKLSEFIKNDKMIFVCGKCYAETEKTKASEWEKLKVKYF